MCIYWNIPEQYNLTLSNEHKTPLTNKWFCSAPLILPLLSPKTLNIRHYTCTSIMWNVYHLEVQAICMYNMISFLTYILVYHLWYYLLHFDNILFTHTHMLLKYNIYISINLIWNQHETTCTFHKYDKQLWVLWRMRSMLVF